MSDTAKREKWWTKRLHGRVRHRPAGQCIFDQQRLLHTR